MHKFLILILLLIISCDKTDHNFTYEGLKEINGTELYLNAFGEGEPLLIIHGGPGLSHDYFLPQLNGLKNSYNLIFFDQRVSGRSSADVNSDSISFNIFVEDIEALRKVSVYDRIHILAHSWGSLLAVKYASQYPEHVDKLILSNPVPLNKEYDAELQKVQMERMTEDFQTERSELMNSKEFQDRELSAYEDLFKMSFGLSFHAPEKLSDLNFILYEGFFERNSALQKFTGLEDYDLYTDLAGIESDILVIRGKSDISLLKVDKRIPSSNPKASIVEFEESGHFPFVEQKETFLNTLRKFLDSESKKNK